MQSISGKVNKGLGKFFHTSLVLYYAQRIRMRITVLQYWWSWYT